MIRPLSEVQTEAAHRLEVHGTARRYLVCSVVEVSQLDDIYAAVCNGDRVGIECPEWDWGPGETSCLEDAAQAVSEHLTAHRTSARYQAQVKNP